MSAQTITQVHRVWINAPAQKIWDAITEPEWTRQYGYRQIADYDLRPGGHYQGHATPEMQAMGMPELVVDGEVLEADPPKKLVQTWRFLWSDEIRAEGPNRITFEIDEAPSGVCRLTVTSELVNAPETSAMLAGEAENAGGGWAYVLSDLKSLLETGSSLPNPNYA